jgi:TonB-dependent Receptor Plug Domain
VLPSEVITSLPNANVADALGRLPSVTLARDEGEGVYVQVRGAEPRLTNVTINGVNVPSPEPTVRAVRLDALPADLVESVEINKTLSANQEGDGIGGSVNFRTKTASDRPTLIASALGGHNTILGGRNNSQFGLTAGKRFGADKRLGLLIGASYDYNGRGIDDIEPAASPSQSTFAAPFYDNDTVREYRYYRKRLGGAGSGDYKIGQASDLYVRGIYSTLRDYGDKWYYSPLAAGAPKFYTSSKRPEYRIGSVSAGANHLLSRSWVNWEFAAAHGFQSRSAGNPKADFSWIGPTLTCGFNPSAQTDTYLPTFGNNCDGLVIHGRAAHRAGALRLHVKLVAAARLRARPVAAGSVPARPLRHGGRFDDARAGVAGESESQADAREQLRRALRAVSESGRHDSGGHVLQAADRSAHLDAVQSDRRLLRG